MEQRDIRATRSPRDYDYDREAPFEERDHRVSRDPRETGDGRNPGARRERERDYNSRGQVDQVERDHRTYNSGGQLEHREREREQRDVNPRSRMVPRERDQGDFGDPAHPRNLRESIENRGQGGQREARERQDRIHHHRDDTMDIDPPTTHRLTTYFLPGDGISREVIQADICRYLGPDATSLPASRDGRNGYRITAYRMLTTRMIEDLMADSKRWEEELRRPRQRGTRPVYGDTEIQGRRHEFPIDSAMSDFAHPGTRSERDDHNMDYPGRSDQQAQRTGFQTTGFQSMSQNNPQIYPGPGRPFQNTHVASQDYVLAPGPGDSQGYVPRSEYERYTATGAVPRGAATRPPSNQGHFGTQPGIQAPASFQDPRSGQMAYSLSGNGRGLESGSRHTPSGNGRRR